MNRRLAVVVAVIISVAGCGGNATPTSPTSPPPTSSLVSPAGSWSGSISDPISGEGTAQVSLNNQVENSLTGTWSATFRNGDSFSGPAVATPVQPNGYLITLSVRPLPPCDSGSGAGGSTLLAVNLINVAVTSSRLTAVSGRFSCSPGLRFGTVNLSKQ